MRTHQVVNVVLRPLILASTMTGFSLSGFAEDANLGKMEYCHGQNGKGNGPVSAELRTKPTDLTLIAKKNGRVFPSSEVLYQIIDGRRTIRAHGSYEMPVWGSIILRSESEEIERNRILAIIGYLKTIQIE